MKNLYPKIFVLAVLLAFAGCGDDSSDDDDGGGSDASTGGEVVTISTADGNLVFMPADITISAGDTVRFEMTSTHNAIEVTEETYNARGTTPIEGGFEVDFGETASVTFTTPGVHYYVCAPHAALDMIGTITVE
ncbi:MAG: plastocyanin/azurin family copper-binding protein [Myxococcota bacterium]